MPFPLHVLVNDFAIRSFRDTADQDYIAARLAFRSTLIPQFHWAALQALEKYLKCILVLHRVRAPRGHDLTELIRVLAVHGQIDLAYDEQTQKFIEYLDTYGRHRYFESSWAVYGHELVLLDWAVWATRRFAQVLICDETKDDPEARAKRLHQVLSNAREAGSRLPQQFAIEGGLLEQILNKPDHPARPALVWQNPCFGKSRRRVKYWPGLRAANSPLTLHPQILDEILKYVWLPRDVKDAYRLHATNAA